MYPAFIRTSGLSTSLIYHYKMDSIREISAASPLARDMTKRPAVFALPLLIGLFAAYLLPGMIGPEPWKPDEPYFFGMVLQLLQGGDWIIPTLGGEPFMEKPPLLMWVAAVTAYLASPLLPLHEGARLATLLFMGLAMAAIAKAARQWWGPGHGRLAMLALLACFGLTQYSHALIADIPLMSGFAISLYGLSLALSRPMAGGALIGTGAGIGLLAKGLFAPGVIGLVAILLPVFFAPWRSRTYAAALLFALLAALPWMVIWPLALYMKSPGLFTEWLWTNNIGRFLGFSVPQLGAAKDPWQWQQTLPWFTFPALPLTGWTLWQRRLSVLQDTGIQACLLMAVMVVAVLVSSASARTVYALPLLIPLAVLSVPSLETFSSQAARRVDWVARALFGGLALFAWGVWIYSAVNGRPPQLALFSRHLPMDFQFAIFGWGLVAAVVLALAWLTLLTRLPSIQRRGLTSWVAGIALAWGTAMTLWLPWFNAAKSYREIFSGVMAAIPANTACVASHGLGESERGMLQYYAGLKTQRIEIHNDSQCGLVLAQSVHAIPPLWWMERGWKTVWEGSRPGEKREHFWLLARPAASKPL
jgi:4-amino-4-deoxy-L-arabinose transferase-like glycosyltransferase